MIKLVWEGGCLCNGLYGWVEVGGWIWIWVVVWLGGIKIENILEGLLLKGRVDEWIFEGWIIVGIEILYVVVVVLLTGIEKKEVVGGLFVVYKLSVRLLIGVVVVFVMVVDGEVWMIFGILVIVVLVDGVLLVGEEVFIEKEIFKVYWWCVCYSLCCCLLLYRVGFFGIFLIFFSKLLGKFLKIIFSCWSLVYGILWVFFLIRLFI